MEGAAPAPLAPIAAGIILSSGLSRPLWDQLWPPPGPLSIARWSELIMVGCRAWCERIWRCVWVRIRWHPRWRKVNRDNCDRERSRDNNQNRRSGVAYPLSRARPLSRAPRAQSPRIVALKQLLDRSRGSGLRERWTESEREGAFGARSPLFQFNSFETVGSSPIALVFSRPLRGALGPLPGFLPPAGRRHDGDAAFYGGKRGKKRPEKTRRTSEFATAKRTQRRWRSG